MISKIKRNFSLSAWKFAPHILLPATAPPSLKRSVNDSASDWFMRFRNYKTSFHFHVVFTASRRVGLKINLLAMMWKEISFLTSQSTLSCFKTLPIARRIFVVYLKLLSLRISFDWPAEKWFVIWEQLKSWKAFLGLSSIIHKLHSASFFLLFQLTEFVMDVAWTEPSRHHLFDTNFFRSN